MTERRQFGSRKKLSIIQFLFFFFKKVKRLKIRTMSLKLQVKLSAGANGTCPGFKNGTKYFQNTFKKIED